MLTLVNEKFSFFFDYLNDEKFICNSSLFKDYLHMNIQGAKSFTPVV